MTCVSGIFDLIALSIWFLSFQIKCFCFGFCLLNSESDAHLPVDRTLVYSHPKTSLLFVSLVQNYFSRLSTHISVSFWLLLLYLASCRTGILTSTFPNLYIFFYHFWLIMNASWYQMNMIIFLCPYKTNLATLILLSSHMFLFCFYP